MCLDLLIYIDDALLIDILVLDNLNVLLNMTVFYGQWISMIQGSVPAKVLVSWCWKEEEDSNINVLIKYCSVVLFFVFIFSYVSYFACYDYDFLYVFLIYSYDLCQRNLTNQNKWYEALLLMSSLTLSFVDSDNTYDIV